VVYFFGRTLYYTQQFQQDAQATEGSRQSMQEKENTAGPTSVDFTPAIT